jgi:Tautomerase enzyme
MPLVDVKLAAGAFTEKQKHDMAARLTDVMVAFEGSEAFREVVWVAYRGSPARRLAHRRSAVLRAAYPDGRPRPVESRV